MRQRHPYLPGLLIGIFLVLFTLLVLSITMPEQVGEWVKNISPGCPLRRLTGIACPGCGGTRAVQALLQGDFIGAFRHNLLCPLIILALLVEYGRLCAVHIFGLRNGTNQRYYYLAFCIFGYLTLLWFILRNILGI